MRILLAHEYGCLMARLPEALAKKVRAFALSIPSDWIKHDDGESGIEGDVHVTVKYGIHTQDLADVSAAISEVMPFWIRLGRISSFHSPEAVVLKIGVQSPELFRFNKLVCNRLEHTNTFPVYKPHVTVAYLKKDEMFPYYYREFCQNCFEGQEFLVDTVVFSSSDGKKQ